MIDADRFVEPVRAPRAHEVVVARTVEAIERRRLRAGERLPNVGELAEELGVSRPTVREALRVLEDAGVLAVRKGGGGGVTLVSELLPTPELSSDELEETDIVDVVTARRVLEGAIVEHATQTATQGDFEEIERTVDLFAAHLDSPELSARADAMFHRAVVRASRSRTLERSLAEVNRLLGPIRAVYPPGPDENRRTLDVHRRQLGAMRSRDPDAVRRVVDEHFLILEETIAARRGQTVERLFGRTGGR